MSDAEPREPRLLDRVREAIRLGHYSIRTEEARPVDPPLRRLPREAASTGDGGREIAAFLSHLAVDGNVAAATENQALNALVFLYREVLKQEIGSLGDLVRARRPRRHPSC